MRCFRFQRYPVFQEINLIHVFGLNVFVFFFLLIPIRVGSGGGL
jgi:hypothetical protein